MKSTISKLTTFALGVFTLVASASAATLSTEKLDYLPGSEATLTGAGFAPGETVSVQVLHADGTPDEGEDHEPWQVTAGDDGGFITTWHVCEDDCVGSTLRATAIGGTSTLQAESIFTDATAAFE